MLEFKKYDDITHWICGVYSAIFLHWITGWCVEGMGRARTDFSGTLTAPTTTASSTIQGPYCEASVSVYWCLKVALFKFYFLFSFSHPSPLPPAADTALASGRLWFSCPPSPWMQWFSFIPHPTPSSSLWTRPWSELPNHHYTRTRSESSTMAATIGV